MDYVNGIIIIKYKYVIKIKYKNNNVYIYMMDTVISEENVKANQQINKKEELILNIKEWISMDNDLKKLKHEVKEKSNKKKELTEKLVNVMNNHSIDCFDINGGSLVYKKKKTRKTISGKFLLTQLEEYYKEQPELAKEITKKVLDNRLEVIKEEIKRK
jgi:hypothetical protein